MNPLFSYFWGRQDKSPLPPHVLRLQRVLKLSLVFMGGALLSLILVQLSLKRRGPSLPETPKTAVLKSALDSVSPQERWTHRLQKEAEKASSAAKDAQKEAVAAQNQQKILEKKVDVLESLFKSLEGPLKEKEEEASFKQEEKRSPLPLKGEEKFPPEGGGFQSSSSHPFSGPGRGESVAGSHEGVLLQDLKPTRPKILHLSVKSAPLKRPQTVDSYAPSGTYARGILLSGLAVSTALATQNNPQPLIIRLADPGVIPRGFRSDLKDAVLIGACHGDLSAERAFCRLTRMTLVERNGEVLERPVEGWIFGEDGRPGLKGDVVDRAGDLARNALMAGILGGMAKFLENQSTSSLYPVSPLGPPNALKGKNMLAGGAVSGASNALERLAEFSIKRAEQMQPVILVASGREVDVFFKEGVDLSASTFKQELTLLGDPQRREHAKGEARRQDIQLH